MLELLATILICAVGIALMLAVAAMAIMPAYRRWATDPNRLRILYYPSGYWRWKPVLDWYKHGEHSKRERVLRWLGMHLYFNRSDR